MAIASIHMVLIRNMKLWNQHNLNSLTHLNKAITSSHTIANEFKKKKEKQFSGFKREK